MSILLRIEHQNQRDLIDLHTEAKNTVQKLDGVFTVLSGGADYRIFEVKIPENLEPTFLKSLKRIVAPLGLELTTAFVPDYMVQIKPLLVK
jgi:hypothetical protein